MPKDKEAPELTGPERTVQDYGVPYGLKCFGRRTLPGYVLDGGSVLLETERDAKGNYLEGAGMDGMYLKTGRRFAPVKRDGDGKITAFREVKPEPERDAHNPARRRGGMEL